MEVHRVQGLMKGLMPETQGLSLGLFLRLSRLMQTAGQSPEPTLPLLHDQVLTQGEETGADLARYLLDVLYLQASRHLHAVHIIHTHAHTHTHTHTHRRTHAHTHTHVHKQ